MPKNIPAHHSNLVALDQEKYAKSSLLNEINWLL